MQRASLVLEEVPPVLFLGAREVAFLRERVHLRNFEPGAQLLVADEHSPGLYVIKSGLVSVAVQCDEASEREIARLGSGECVGELSFMSNVLCSATVRAVTESKAWFIERADFADLVLQRENRGYWAEERGLVELVNARPLHKGDGALASSTGARGPFAGCRIDAEGAKAMSENQDETPEQRPRWHDRERPNVNLEWERQVEAIKPELKALSEDKRFTEGAEAIAEMDLSDWIQELPTEERETILNATLSDLDDHLRTIEGLSIDDRKVIIGKMLSALDERLRGVPTRKFILEASLAGLVAFAAEGAPQFVGRFGIQNLRAWVFAQIETCVYTLLGDDAAARQAQEDFYGWLALQRPEPDNPAVFPEARKMIEVPGMSDHHRWQVRELLNSWLAKQKPGPKLGSHQMKKRDPGKFRRECKKVGEFWEKGLKKPESIFLLIMRESSRNPEQARKWVATRYCALLNSAIRNKESRVGPDEDAIRILRIESYLDEKSQLPLWKLTH